MCAIRTPKLSSPSKRGIACLIAEIETSASDVCTVSADALHQVHRGILTGEGPSAHGRVHFSRTIDVDDTALCRRILILAGRGGRAVSRLEADALFEIHAAGRERLDGGLFDDLLAKAVMHHVICASGFEVPVRHVAVDPATSPQSWIFEPRFKGEAGCWLAFRLRQMQCAGMPPRKLARLAGAPAPEDGTIARAFDLAA
jgi:hypothetical protein